MGRAFLEIVVPAALSGQLAAVTDDSLPAEVALQLRAWGMRARIRTLARSLVRR